MTIAALTTLKGQFEAGANHYPRLSHLLAESIDGKLDQLTGPFPLYEFNRTEQAMGMSLVGGGLTCRIKGTWDGNPKIGEVHGIAINQFHAFYISETERSAATVQLYSQGVARYKQLAARAGELLMNLPASILNCYPPEWRSYESCLRTYQVREPDASEAGTDKNPRVSEITYDAILPAGGSDQARWDGFLHWLGWAGEAGLGSNTKRQSWSDFTSYPYFDSRDHFDRFMSNLPIALRPRFEDTRTFFSTIVDVFLCSALAIDFIIAKLAEHESSEPQDLAGARVMKSPDNTVLNSDKRGVFISYSHHDTKFLEQLVAHLVPLERSRQVTAWSDRQIKPGLKWFKEIQKAVSVSKVAVLLVTKDFLASDFIDEHELGPLLREAERGGVAIRWVLVRDCNWKQTPLKDYQAAYPTAKPLANMRAERDAAWVSICESIKNAITN